MIHFNIDDLFKEVQVQEWLTYWVYENKKVVKEGTIKGNTWGTTGKNQLAECFKATTNYPINTFYYTCASTNYTETRTPANVGGGVMTLTSSELTTTGLYSSVGGGNSGIGQYNTITVSLTLTTGQSVIFQITYTFTPSSPGVSCAARLCQDGNYNDYIRSIAVWDASLQRGIKDSTNSRTNNILTCDNATNFTFGSSYTLLSIVFYHAGGYIFYTASGLNIPVTSSEELDVQGRFTFG